MLKKPANAFSTFIPRATLAAALIGLSTAAHATNGYFAHGTATKNKDLTGAGVALSQDAMAAATNPAGMAFVGERMDVGLALFSPIREYTVTGNPSGAPFSFGLVPATAESDNELFYIPHLGMNWAMGANDTFGVTIYGNGGMNTDYSAEETFGIGTFGSGTAAGVDLA